MKKIKMAVLVYQGGIANVFAVNTLAHFEDQNARRLTQGTFTSCVDFARGIAATGVPVRTRYCNQAGDIINFLWDNHKDDAPFQSEIVDITQN